MRRAVALHPTDYNYGNLAAKQAFHYSLFQWLPYFGSNTVPLDRSIAYPIRSGHAMNVVLGYDLRRKDLDYALLRKLAGSGGGRALLLWRLLSPDALQPREDHWLPGSSIGPSRATASLRHSVAAKKRRSRPTSCV